ncbi:glutamate-rich protein 3 isoform X2 [Sceloporus undulatus]|uniref:glutamate-rich protein 3 isoform X2 n=1 Tax=Sceloporus undulatus TaxID=8520 RepID=UPI001C4B8C18|nr:glutamate-rich protein 3 isoform X2 [Sceloporus undulatus]
MRKDHQKYIRECLAQAIFHKVLDMERHHQVEIKRKLENSAKRERVQRIKVERSRKAAEETNHLLSPHPPTAPRNRFARRKISERGETGNLTTYPRPNTAPGNIQHPLRLQPLYGNATVESTPKATSTSRAKFLTFEKEHQLPSGGDKGILKPMHPTDYSSGISPYRFPIINNYVIPIPPPPKSEKNMSTVKGVALRGRRLRPTTAPNGMEQLLMRDTGKFYRPQVHSNAYVTMIYLGKTVHLSYDLLDYREEIKIYQQHCGGENLCVYRGKLLEGETFHFISRRHYGFPFSLTFYLNGIQVDRLSSCCEYKHRKGTRLGGKHGHFGFVNVERSAPCYRCIISMGLDKKPSPPKKKMTDEEDAKKEESEKEEMKYKLRESSRSGGEEEKDSLPQFSPTSVQRKAFAEDTKTMEWDRKKEMQKASDESEKYQRSSAYDEDFEADEEKSDEKVNEEGQADDQMNGMSKSPSDDEKDNLDHEKENKKSSQKALRASDSERDESDGYGESDSEREDKQEKKLASSHSSSSILYSSENVSDSETRKQDEEQDNTDVHSEYESEMTKSQREESQEMDVEEEDTISEVEDTTAKHMPGISDELKMESDLRDTSPACEKLTDMNKKAGMEEDLSVYHRSSSPEEKPSSTGPSEDEEEGECKSVKKKIAEAIEHDQLLSSEPEPSDSSTEDEEEGVPATRDKHEDGSSLAKKSKALKSQKVAEQVEERQMVGKERALEEEELVDEECPKEAVLEEEFLVRKQDQTVSKEIELEEEAVVESDLDDAEKDITYGEGKISDGKTKVQRKVQKMEVMAAEHEISDGEVISGESQLEGEEVKDHYVTKKLIAVGKDSEGVEGAEEVTEASEILETIELVGKKPIEGEPKTKEIMEEALQTGEVLGTESEEASQKHMVEAEGNATLQELEHEAGGVERASLKEDKSMTGSGLMRAEYMEEEIYIKIKLGEPGTKDKEKDISLIAEGMIRTEKTALDEESLVQFVREDVEQVETEEMLLISRRATPKRNLEFEKEELFTENISEGLVSMTDETEERVDIKEVKAKRKVVVKEETEAEGTERKQTSKEKVEAEKAEREAEAEEEAEDEETNKLLSIKWEMRNEGSETEGEVVSLVTESEGEPVSEMTFMRWQSVMNMREDTEAEAEHVPESSSQKVTVIGLNRETGKNNESCLEDEVEERPEETAAGQKAVYLEVQSEGVTDDEEEDEDEESSTEEQMTGEGITLADVEEALLIGIQQLITEVSRMNEEVEDKEEEPEEEILAEEMSTQEDPEKEDFVSVVVTNEKWHAESDKAEEEGVREPVEGNNGSENRTRGQEESPAENLAVTKIIHWSMQHSEGEQPPQPPDSSD